jgi:hypothetical protein
MPSPRLRPQLLPSSYTVAECGWDAAHRVPARLWLRLSLLLVIDTGKDWWRVGSEPIRRPSADSVMVHISDGAVITVDVVSKQGCI